MTAGMQIELAIENGVRRDVQTPDGDTMLHLAAYAGKADDAKLLIEKGAPLNAKNELGRTPLQLASSNGHTEVARLLIQKGALIDADYKEVPLTRSGALIPAPPVVRLDVQTTDGDTMLHLAAYAGKADDAKLLIEKGAPLDAKNKLGHTPLQLASWNGHDEVAKLLIQKGALIDADYKKVPPKYKTRTLPAPPVARPLGAPAGAAERVYEQQAAAEEYLQRQDVNLMLSELTMGLAKEKPKDPLPWSIDFLEAKLLAKSRTGWAQRRQGSMEMVRGATWTPPGSRPPRAVIADLIADEDAALLRYAELELASGVGENPLFPAPPRPT